MPPRATDYGVVFVTEENIKIIGGCMMALATAFVIARFWIRAIKHRFFVGEEIPIHIAWACMMAVCINFIVLTPTLYKIAAVLRDERPADADYVKDVELSLRIFFVNFPLFWSSLWCVKIAMLVQCKRLVERQRTHTIFWWCILAFTGASYLACILNQLTPCKSLRASLNYPGCESRSDKRRAEVTMYFTYCMDVLTDLMIIAFPIPILSRLRLNRSRKASIMVIFGVAAIVICVATVCVAEMAIRTSGRRLNPSWLVVWGMVESPVAVVVGCLPTFGLLLPPAHPTSQRRYDSGMKKTSGGLSGISESALHDDTFPMRACQSKSPMNRLTSDSNNRVDMISANESGVRIAPSSPTGVMVTNTFEIDEPTLATLPPATLPPAKYTLNVV